MIINSDQPKLTIILPCQNEEASLAGCLQQIENICSENNLAYQLIVSDSSTDRSPQIAREQGAELVAHGKNGYGNAYLEGFKSVKGEFIFMADADGTYDFKEIIPFLNYLEAGYDLVIGNRFSEALAIGVMPLNRQYLGNPMLSALFRLMFKSDVRDVHCGMRALSRDSWMKLNLKSEGMEFASEMLISAVRHNLKIKQLPIKYYGRQGQSKLRPLADGWRHIKLMAKERFLSV